MTGAGAAQDGDTRRRAPYLIDDTGFFDIEDWIAANTVDPIIRGG